MGGQLKVTISMPASKKRRTYKRVNKEDSAWWRKYLRPDMTLNMEVEPQGRVAKKFRRRFRLPYLTYKSKVLAMAKDRWWPTWHDKEVDAFGRLICGLELKLLGALFVLANGSTHFTVSEFTDMSEEVHRKFFITWLGHVASVKDEFIYSPATKLDTNLSTMSTDPLAFLVASALWISSI